jgi:PTH1 family peptidyl-tRNA hydrolase
VQQIISSTLALTITPSMAAPIRLLVCSIGNPAPYLNTFHSAGHILNTALAHTLSYPSFQKSREYGKGLISIGSEYTLWQSSSYMNVSGEGVAAAWRRFVKDSRGEQVGLVILHDELELRLGAVKVKKGDASAKGHNGLKSIKERLQGVAYTRIGVGIGRPESRAPDEVARYVLMKMTSAERAKIEGAVERVQDELTRMSGR